MLWHSELPAFDQQALERTWRIDLLRQCQLYRLIEDFFEHHLTQFTNEVGWGDLGPGIENSLHLPIMQSQEEWAYYSLIFYPDIFVGGKGCAITDHWVKDVLSEPWPEAPGSGASPAPGAERAGVAANGASPAAAAASGASPAAAGTGITVGADIKPTGLPHH